MSGDRRDVVLVGPRGAGKSAVGRLLSVRMGRPFVDTDALLSERARQSVADLFSKSGEVAFRIKEAEVIDRLQGHGDRVIATGGGAPLLESNRESLANNGFVVFLDVDAETAFARLAADLADRPPLTDLDPRTEVETTISTRRPLYEAFADVVVDARDEVEGVVERVARALRAHGFSVTT